MSTLNVANITDGTDTVATGYVVNGSAKAWGFVIGTGTAAIQDSNNLSSITDNGSGNYTLSYTNSMDNTNYAYQLTVAQLRTSTAGSNFRVHGYPAIATSSITFTTGYVSAVGGTFTLLDVGDINLMLNGDLA